MENEIYLTLILFKVICISCAIFMAMFLVAREYINLLKTVAFMVGVGIFLYLLHKYFGI